MEAWPDLPGWHPGDSPAKPLAVPGPRVRQRPVLPRLRGSLFGPHLPTPCRAGCGRLPRAAGVPSKGGTGNGVQRGWGNGERGSSLPLAPHAARTPPIPRPLETPEINQVGRGYAGWRPPRVPPQERPSQWRAPGLGPRQPYLQ